MTVFEKLKNRMSDLHDDISFLKREDVSLRFKVLNLLSGDRLRSFLVFPFVNIHDAQRTYNLLPELKATGELEQGEYEWLLDKIMWNVNRAEKDLRDCLQL